MGSVPAERGGRWVQAQGEKQMAAVVISFKVSIGQASLHKWTLRNALLTFT